MDKKKKGPFLKLVPANLRAFESSDDYDQESDSSNDSIETGNNILKDDPIIEILEDKQIESTIKNNAFAQASQDDESSQDELYAFKSQDPCIKKLKNSKTVKNEEIKMIEQVNELEKIQQTENIKKSPTKTESKKTKNKQSPTSNKKQRKIFEFGCVTNLPKEDPDECYETVQKIYGYFNNKKSIPLILSVIHQSAGNIYEAIYRLASDAYDYDEENINFNYSSICAVSSDLKKYFI